MHARSPEEIDRLFCSALNEGNLDALVALYEPQAALSPEPGKAVVGTKAIREALSAFVATKPTIAMTTKNLAQTADLALLTSKWDLSGTAADGAPVKMSGQSVEVCRRQKDGSWLFAIDNPWGLT